ncbi:MAG TPA: tRNA (adenosine(37)-N6)-threonylcarbamoyltransferase complex dimerization subunit type 1 TsaB [Solirubrobacteraceae bacterium]|jgi:tRNA threonylcarbamoyladenosine biosynthesis protein TsaB|nr:tRNA (adenosine(37)-N6)-threonylcarbamoyltransferase complex dimerization subunit type 1 TsaB [Solirubrobacteraceae bacterium]
MIVLGFDTATPATVVGLRLADGSALQARDDPAEGKRPGHTTQLLPLAGELLAQAGLRWNAVEQIAVGVGPGTFTGLRVGIATARGLAQSLGIGVVGVSTLRVLAESALRAPEAEWSRAQASNRAPESLCGVLAAIDARRGEAFVALYADGRELAAPRPLRPEQFGSLPGLSEDELDWLAVGDGAVRFRSYVEAVGVAVADDSSPLHRVDAGVLCELALGAPAGNPEAVLPDYRRRPDAEIALEAKLALEDPLT